MQIRSFYIVSALAVLILSVSSTTKAASISFSGNLTGVAFENPAGRCSPLITVSAFGAGTSNLLGAYQDVQSHCTTSLTTFDNGVFTLTSVTSPGNSIFGIYSGTASVQGAVLAFSANLLVQGGTGQFAAASGSLNSQGALDQAGNYTASFTGLVETAPEPASLSFGALGLLVIAAGRFRRGRLR